MVLIINVENKLIKHNLLKIDFICNNINFFFFNTQHHIHSKLIINIFTVTIDQFGARWLYYNKSIYFFSP